MMSAPVYFEQTIVETQPAERDPYVIARHFGKSRHEDAIPLSGAKRTERNQFVRVNRTDS
jgi:hypothetical protein